MAVTKCCCFDLRTGTLILFILEALFVFSIFNLGSPNGGGSGVIFGIAGALGIYAIYNEKPDFMLPSIVMNIIVIVGLIINAILVPFFTAFVASMFQNNKDAEKAKEAAIYICIGFEIFLVLWIVLSVYFYKVKRAYHSQMRTEIAAKTHNVHAANNMERGIYPKA